MAEELETLPGPYEIFEMEDGETRVLRIQSYAQGTIRIQTSEVPEGKEVNALRIYVGPSVKPIGVNWWDITSQTLIAQLMPYLEAPRYTTKEFTIKKYGVRPKARFTVEVRPGA